MTLKEAKGICCCDLSSDVGGQKGTNCFRNRGTCILSVDVFGARRHLYANADFKESRQQTLAKDDGFLKETDPRTQVEISLLQREVTTGRALRPTEILAYYINVDEEA